MCIYYLGVTLLNIYHTLYRLCVEENYIEKKYIYLLCDKLFLIECLDMLPAVCNRLRTTHSNPTLIPSY